MFERSTSGGDGEEMTARKRQVNRIRGSVLAVSWLVVCASARAQWTAIRLHGPGDYLSRCLSVGNQQQGGWRQAGPSSPHQPVIWSGSSGSEVNLALTPSDVGEINAQWQGLQGGIFNGHASLWQGTSASRVDLDPGIANTHGTWIQAMRGTQQAGYIIAPSTASHAAMWNGTAASFVDLNPAGANYSYAYATDGTQQGGIADFTIAGQFYQHAALWSGSAASFVDLNPLPLSGSVVTGMVPGQQAGWYHYGPNGGRHAALWSGTAASMIDLHPFPGFGSSQLLATDGAIQVGDSHVPGGGSFVHAGIWFGTAASFVDLHSFLPAGYSSSSATSVFQVGGVIYVGGVASNPLAGTSEAFMWINVPAPSTSALVFAGMLLRRRPGRRPHRTPE